MGAWGANTFPSRNRLPYPFFSGRETVVLFCGLLAFPSFFRINMLVATLLIFAVATFIIFFNGTCGFCYALSCSFTCGFSLLFPCFLETYKNSHEQKQGAP